MSENEKLLELQTQVGEEVEQAVLLSSLRRAGQAIINKAYPFHTHITEVPDKYALLQCEIACYLLNKRGAEGEKAHNENGINRTYESAGIPDSMLDAVIPVCKVVK